jgi:hypothetical protein
VTSFREASFPESVDQLRRAPDSALRRGLLADAWLEWTRRDPQAAIASLATAGDDPAMESVREALAVSFTMKNAAAAVEIAGTPAGDAIGLQPAEVAVQALTRDPKGALEVITRAPGASGKNAETFASAWSGLDRPAAVEWAQRLPVDSPLRGPAMDGIARQWSQEDPAQFGQWAQSLAEGPERTRAMEIATSSAGGLAR